MNPRNIALTAFVFSGMAALIYEVVWIRPLQYIFGSTIYTISIIFAAFLAGLGLGAWIISRYISRINNLLKAYALLELGIGLYGILLISIFNVLPSVYRAIYPLSESVYLFEFIKFVLTFAVLLVPTALMGATFPVIAKFYTKEKIGKGIGEVYSANNIGAIIGSFVAGFILVPVLGIKYSIVIAGLINIVLASVILSIGARQLAKKLVPAAFAVFLVLSLGYYDIQKLYAGGFNRARAPEEEVLKTNILFYKEGLHATINVIEEGKSLAFLINGYGQGSTFFADLRVNFLLVYLPLLARPESQNALVVGLGTGTTAGQVSQFLNTTTVEIEPAVVEASKYFWFANVNVSENPNHKLVLDDARNYLLRNMEKYDIIISEPTNTWQSFSTALFSKEFLELVRARLNEGGLYAQWVPIYDFSPEDFRSFYRTFNSVFPHVVAFVNYRGEETGLATTEIILVGSAEPIEYRDIEKNFDLLPPLSKDYLRIVGIDSSQDLMGLMLFTSEQMQGYGSGARLVTDDNALLEFSTALYTLRANPNEVMTDINRFLGAKR